ncbi:MAG: hypothetical protein SGJ24_18895 [Chloroflexota bacterium]|nr:hypothetical protein [Chloroflexota bacterium]
MDDPHAHYRPDLKDFARYGILDAYELTDEEIAALLEVWRWAQWRARESPSDEVREAVASLQRHLANAHNVEVEYNTAGLLKGAIEPLMYLRVLRDLPGAIIYFVIHPLAFVRALIQVRRLDVAPVRGQNGEPLGYPKENLPRAARAPDLLKRAYWKQVSAFTFAERKRMDYWW